MRRPAIALLATALLVAACATSSSPPSAVVPEPSTASAEAVGLGHLLPDPESLPGLSLDGDSDEAVGEDLFRLINGGAELYLKHGFVRAIVQDYAAEGRNRFSVEIFEMKDAAAAKAVYAARGGSETAEPVIGEAGTFEEYYGLYREGRYYFSVASSRTRGELRPPIEQLARAVVERMQLHH